MTFLYTATERYDNSEDTISWKKYIEFSKLTHLTELVSLDYMLCEKLVEPHYDSGDDWKYIHVVGQDQTGFYTSLEYVFKRLNKKDKYNLLTVVLEPIEKCEEINVQGYEFMGYDLLDQSFGNSALTNCGGFDETFLPNDLNNKGLLSDFSKAYEIKKRLLENNPGERHADTNVIAIWRHKTIGR